jgi:hypothetical protein
MFLNVDVNKQGRGLLTQDYALHVLKKESVTQDNVQRENIHIGKAPSVISYLAMT